MRKILILGNTFAAWKTAHHIRRCDPQAGIVLLPLGEPRVCRWHRMASYLARQTAAEDFFDGDAAQPDALSVEVLDGDVEKISCKRNYVQMAQDNRRLEFDALIITDTGADKLPAVKGIGRSGVFAFRCGRDLQKVQAALSMTETVVVRSATLKGAAVAMALGGRKIERILVCPQEELFAGELDPQTAGFIRARLERAGLRVVTGAEITEVLGDGDVRAVRLNSGKVLGCEMVVVPDAGPDGKMFKDSGLMFEERVSVNEEGRTSLEQVFALGDCADWPGLAATWADPRPCEEYQARQVAGAVCNQPDRGLPQEGSSSEPGTREYLLGDVPVWQAGNCRDYERCVVSVIRESESLRTLYLKDGRARGAVLVACEEEKGSMLDLIRRGGEVAGFAVPAEGSAQLAAGGDI